MPLIGTRGAASAQGFGEFAQSAAPVYIEDVFSTYLYTGNGSTQTITNGIDFSGKGGMLWIKNRTNVASHAVVDTARGSSNWMQTNTTNGEASNANIVTGFNLNGFGLGNQAFFANSNGDSYVSWSFRKQTKFFDIVTYTGNGVSGRQISHNLGSAPGFIIIKPVSQPGGWVVAHRGNGTTAQVGGYLDTTGQLYPDTNQSLYFNSTYFVPTNLDGSYNTNGTTYVAYLFAHNAGGFGTAGTDNVISCGSYTGNGSTNGPTINLGYEPQWILIKRTDTSGQYWCVWDNMRGIVTGGNDPVLYPNVTDAENTGSDYLEVNATGFQLKNTFTAINASGSTYIYIAIRRGPMKTPTSGTSVFSANATNAQTYYTTGFPVDAVFAGRRAGGPYNFQLETRLLGNKSWLVTSTSDAELTPGFTTAVFDNNTQSYNGSYSNSTPFAFHNFQRAPGFMDVVCYTGTGANRTLSHNLGVVPEFMIVKSRSGAYAWVVYHKDLGATKYVFLNYNAAVQTGNEAWNDTSPTSTQFTVSLSNYTGANATTYVAYLFASCPGVSKVGSYSGTGGTQTISCGFAARYVLIKRTDSTGDWWVWDTARGMVSGTDPRLGLNLQTTEQNADWVYTNASGFQIVTTDAAVNASGGSYIYLAIA